MLYTDGQHWYQIPESATLPQGTLGLFSLQGPDLMVDPVAASHHSISNEQAQALLRGVWKTAEAQTFAVLIAIKRLFPDEDIGGQQARKFLQKLMAGDLHTLATLRDRAEQVGKEVGGVAGEAITMLPDRLRSVASLRYGRLRPTHRAGQGGLSDVEAEAETLLATIYNAGPGKHLRSTMVLRPRDSDFDQVFSESVCAQMRNHFGHVWAESIAPEANSEEREINAHAATVDDLRNQTERGTMFPRQYAAIIPHLLAGPTWVRWWTAQPGETRGMSHEGLIKIQDRWIWLPRSWKGL